MEYLNHEHILFDFEASPYLLDAATRNKHGVFIIKFLVREYTLFVDDYQSFLPFSQNLRFFEYFSEIVAVFYEGCGYAGDVGRVAFEQFPAHIVKFLLDDGGKDIVVEGKALIVFRGSSYEDLIGIDGTEFDAVTICDADSVHEFDFMKLFKEVGFGGDK